MSRIALISEGTYPIVTGGVSTWVNSLLSCMPDHEFSIVTLVGADRTRRWELPGNVRDVTLVPMWDAVPTLSRLSRRAVRTEVEQALAQLWSGVLPPDGGEQGDLQATEQALRALAVAGRSVHLGAMIAQVGSTRWLLRAWEQHRAGRADLPALTLAHAAEAGRLADRILAVLGADFPEVDVMHVASNGPASLVALARYWRDGTPFILTEHGVYLRERYLALTSSGMAWPVRYALMSLLRVICRHAYDAAYALAPVSDFNASWATRLGADPAKSITVRNGVDPAQYRPPVGEPTVPTVSSVGRIDPIKGLDTLIEAFALVHAAVPDARLRLFGPLDGPSAAYHACLVELAERLGISDVVTFEGSVPTAVPAITAGHVVALSSVSEGLPYSLIEAMMCGRATVTTDVGGAAECAGRDGTAGLVVPPRDPQAMAAALLSLLLDDDRRHAMGAAARERALARFSLEVFQRSFNSLYAAAAGLRWPAAGPDSNRACVRTGCSAPPAEPVGRLEPALAGVSAASGRPAWRALSRGRTAPGPRPQRRSGHRFAARAAAFPDRGRQ